MKCAGASTYQDGKRLPAPAPCKASATEKVDGVWYCAVHASKAREPRSAVRRDQQQEERR